MCEGVGAEQIIIGECIYCRQTRQVNMPVGTPEEEVNRIATLGCECSKSLESRKAEETKRIAQNNINILFQEDYPPHGQFTQCGVISYQPGKHG